MSDPIVSANPPNYSATSPAGAGSGARSQSQTIYGGTRVAVGDGAGNDVSAAHPFPVSVAGVTASLDATATAAAPTYVEGTANPLSQTLAGALRTTDTNFPAAVSTGTGAQGASSPRFTVATDTATIAGSAPGTAGTPSANIVSVQGPTASGSTLTATPQTIGGRAATTNPTAVADTQVVNAMFDKLGKQIAIGIPRVLKGSQKTSISNSTAETTIITAGASGVFNDLYGLILANSGASTTKVDLRDATSGSIIATIEVPTLETRGFMLPVDSGFSQTTAANNWTAQCTTATTALEVTALFAKNT